MAPTNYDKWANIDVSDSDEEEYRTPREPPPKPTERHSKKELLERLTRAEELHEQLSEEKAHIAALEERRDANREALVALSRAERTHAGGAAAAQQQKPQKGASASAAQQQPQKPQKIWMCHTETFLKTPVGAARQSLEEDQAEIDEEIKALRASVRRNASKLCELDPSIAAAGADGQVGQRTFESLHEGYTAAELEAVAAARPAKFGGGYSEVAYHR